MAVVQRGNKVYAKVSDLSEESSLKNGDKIVFHSSATGIDCLVDYANVRIDLDHTTFKDSYEQMLDFSRNAGAWVTEMSDQFNSMSETVGEITQQNVDINNTLAAIKLLVQFVIGMAASGNNGSANIPAQNHVDALPAAAKEKYEQIIAEINNTVTTVGYDTINASTFSSLNLLWWSRNSK